MDGQSRSAGTFPVAWTLRDTRIPIQNEARHAGPLSTYPREWSMSTVPESVSLETETQRAESSPATIRGDFPIALSDLNNLASTATTPSTFETNWALPANADGERDALHCSPSGEFANTSLSLGHRDNGPYPETATTVPSHPLGRVLHGQHPEISPSGVPGNFKYQGYSNSEVSPASRPEPTSSKSANVAPDSIVRRIAGHYDHTSTVSAMSESALASPESNWSEIVAGQVRFGPQFSTISPLSPWGNDPSSTYQPPRPAGFTYTQITPQSAAETDVAPAELYRPTRPAGFDPDSTSPLTSASMSAQGQQSTSHPPYNPQAYVEGLPAIYERRETGRELASMKIPDLTSTLQVNASSWLLSDADQLYKPPAAPLTATAPWRPEFQ